MGSFTDVSLTTVDDVVLSRQYFQESTTPSPLTPPNTQAATNEAHNETADPMLENLSMIDESISYATLEDLFIRHLMLL